MINGIVSIIKPPGISSHDVVSRVRKKLNTRKVGHAGTLDPGAAGVMVLGVNKGTRLLEYVQNYKKVYRAEITLGYETETGDLFSEITKQKQIESLTEEQWKDLLNSFIGKQLQTPPMTSAIKMDGVRLYELARKGESVEREKRSIEIFSIKLVELLKESIIIDVMCSSGTYVRVLCEDIARKSNNYGVMSFLLRKSIGPFSLDNSNMLDENIEIKPMSQAVEPMESLILEEKQLEDIKHGRALPSEKKFNDNIALISKESELVAIAYYENELIKPKKVFI
ncbi:MAG: tRNA pseudouridine(55) synthase TruB [Clostridia bacterium]